MPMNSGPTILKIRCVAFVSDGQWVAVCLPFSLCAQADTLEEAKTKLHDQMQSYVSEALDIDSAHEERLLNRPAPLRYWFYYGVAQLLKALNSKSRKYKNFKDSVRAVPLAC